MVNDDRSPTHNTWRRESDNFNSRRSSTFRHRREGSFDSNRDRDRDRRDWADRDRDRRDWGDRNRDRDRDRGAGRDDDDRNRDRPSDRDFERGGGGSGDRRPSDALPPPAPRRFTDEGVERKGPAMPKGARADKARPSPLRTGHHLPSSPLRPDTTSSAATHSLAPKKDARDSLANTFLALLKQSRTVGVLEQAKQSLEKMDRQREMQRWSLSKNSDFPSLPELIRPLSEAERAQREEAEAQVAKTANDLSNTSKSFLTQLDNWLQPNAALVDLVRTMQTKQDSMESKLESQAVLQTLQADNATLQGQVKALATLVENLSTRLNTVESTSTKLVTQAGQCTARSITQAAAMGGLEARLAEHGAILAKVEAVDLESLNNFIVTEKPRQQETLNKQETDIAKLKTEMIAVQSGLQEARAAQAQQQDNGTIATPAPSSAPAPTPDVSKPTAPPPAPATTLVFPGDDFTSLRIEISKLNERILPLEKSSEKIKELETRQVKAMARNTIETNKLHEELQKDRKSWNNMSKIFGDLLDKETTDRMVDSERLKELEKNVQLLQSQPQPVQPPPAVGQEQAPPVAPGNDAEMAVTDLEPSLSPVPEPVNATDPVESVTFPAAALPTGAQATPQAQPEGNNAGLQDLENALQILQTRMKATEDEIQSTRRDFNGQCSTIRMMVSTLDSQFNNLTTKELYQAIIGHMERLYPNARQLQEDVRHMAGQVTLMKEHNRAADEALKKLGDAVGLSVIQKRSLAEGTNNSGGDEASAAKRQRTNGTRPPDNGTTNGTAAAAAAVRPLPGATARAGI